MEHLQGACHGDVGDASFIKRRTLHGKPQPLIKPQRAALGMQAQFAVTPLAGGIGQGFQDVAAQARAAHHPFHRHAPDTGHTRLGRVALQQPPAPQQEALQWRGVQAPDFGDMGLLFRPDQRQSGSDEGPHRIQRRKRDQGEQTGRRHWWTGFLYTATYMGFFSWQIYWALASIRGRHWGTRG